MLSAGQRLEELDTQQGGDGVGQHVLDGAGRGGDAEDEHEREALDVAAVEWKETLQLTKRNSLLSAINPLDETLFKQWIDCSLAGLFFLTRLSSDVLSQNKPSLLYHCTKRITHTLVMSP